MENAEAEKNPVLTIRDIDLPDVEAPAPEVAEDESFFLGDINAVSRLIKSYQSFIQPYENANALVRVWLETMQKDFKEQYHHNPIHNIRSRMKTLPSIADKCRRKGLPANFEAAREYLTDIAGTRVICYYIQDVYRVAELLKRQSGTILIRESDYIKDPKPNGYRTYHLILGVSLHTEGQYFPVEVQIRTLAMDFWASMEHQLVYKSDRENKEQLAGELKNYADQLNDMENKLMRFYDGEIPIEFLPNLSMTQNP